MRLNRRRLLQASGATLLSTVAPTITWANTPDPSRTIKAVLHADLRSFDPITTNTYITTYHGGMVYDTLFGLDAESTPQPQMVSKWDVSEDRLTYTFELRDGLAFSDGTPVSSRDCVASIRRWSARDGGGQFLVQRLEDMAPVDDKTFKIVLREPFGLLIDLLAKASGNCCFIMRESEALTDPNEPISTIIGSGPFIFNEDELLAGQRYVYDRNPNYVPRSEPASGTAGGKVVKVDRVIFENLPDQATALAALQRGEIDFYESPPIDLLATISNDPQIIVDTQNPGGYMGWLRPNHLHPPFNHPAARQALLHLVDQEAVMRATFGNPEYYRTCGSFFGCGTTMENDANTDWFKGGQNIERARELFQEAGYAGETVVILQATDVPFMNNSALLLAQWLQEAGVTVELQAGDWGTISARRQNRDKPTEGGWNLVFTYAATNLHNNPIGAPAFAATGDAASYGWPTDQKHEELRLKWAAAETFEARKEVARELQDNAWDFVLQVYLGQWTPPVAYRSNLKGLIAVPELLPFWNIEKT
ncbi:ABC transporter substrate-binding protein [Gemmobacter fulvus]|uniref:ABC transporter substrate-binding protein n=1 Tax=Gemmobacter fulvus TaxID=2840474 RepID=UPI00279686D4|nr:ABC transporter substrate-binding protein [Gemmobacter fulvus]MDQ1850599.1 ABC transporter substrate-binding protein [Gemmobacter fulvus]